MRRSLVLLLLLASIGGACASRERPAPTPFPTPAPDTPSPPPSPSTPPRDTPARMRVRNITLQTDDGRSVTIDLDTYVQGTVAAEAWVRRTEDPEVAERIFEVQALVARTYALANIGRHANDGFDLCSRTHCQVYRSPTRDANWAESIATAVARTSGAMIAFGGVPILALFHANCGGGTSAAEDIWGGTARPYLVAVEDQACDTPAAHWQVTLSRGALVRVFDADARTRVDGRLDSIDVLEADRTGRVMLAALTGARSPVVRGEELRGILGRAFGVRSVRSPRFHVHREGDAFVFEGSGLGHGAGLCQFGAMRRLRAGATPRQVIEHYYPGAQIVRIARRYVNVFQKCCTRSVKRSTTSSRPSVIGGSSISSSVHVLACGMKTARSDASSAGRMSDLGLLPIIHVRAGSRPCRSTSRRYVGASFSATTSTSWKRVRRPERTIFAY